MDCTVELDRRMLGKHTYNNVSSLSLARIPFAIECVLFFFIDYLVGLDTEVEELVEGGTCYTPTVTMKQVQIHQIGVLLISSMAWRDQIIVVNQSCRLFCQRTSNS